ncbi:MAG: GTP 3',8-cyclase MoaA [Rhodospirillaceae bacterium]|jgi:GTP 3',8-cyclase|nr:GTP 3',8-cyclase MoaA [Rhodospirillaceae bacterium]
MSQLIDPFGRAVSYLRVSVTDRCNYRCQYCMSENMNFLPKSDLLTLEELDRLCNAFIRRGVDKIRLTGGEPLVRRNVMSLIRSLGEHVKTGNLKELTLTTNGSQLAKYAHELADCGVKRINVSLDSLNAEKFQSITRWGNLEDVLDGLAQAKDAGLEVKINTVALKDFNENEVDDIISWCGDEGFDLTFIETMPMGEIEDDRTDQYLPLSILSDRICSQWTLEETPYKTGGPANYCKVKETGKRIGFITPLSHNFCESCNRVRLTCTGQLYMCLGQDDQKDLLSPLRMSEGDDLLMAAIDEAIGNKPKGHDFIIDRQGAAPAVARHMSVTGG